MKKVEKLDKELMAKLFDGSMTVKQANDLRGKIEDRCDYIVRTLIGIWGKWNDSRDWWDFSNHGGDGPSGYFDEDSYKEEVDFTGEFNYDGGNIFPTKWIWEDFEDEETKKSIEWKEKEIRDKENAKARREELAKQKKELIASALSKLTKEECKALGHRKPKQ